ncbi:hypothetical protein [Mesomycoplasma dispar]|uniref:M42 glutamyl aminopeptidase n=1 Tax=Mesomycoplasma dispar TaxID=86660 RepID=A0ABN5DRI5_9BACT|nr:hypothetical protein [Mesomycoplasma dispar]ATP59855.1 hypothetical protein CSW10_02885 [Mesomycoplasma dispar]
MDKMPITILEKISKLIVKFNGITNSKINLILKGSAVFWIENKTKENYPNDLDFSISETNLESKQQFLNYIEKNAEIKITKNDGNLFIFSLDNFNIEIVLLEHLNRKFLEESEYEGILFLKKIWSFSQKLLSLPYILSDYFPHDQDQKISRTLAQLSKWKSMIDTNLLFTNEAIDFLKHCMWNSFFIFYWYNYTEMLVFDYGKSEILTKISLDLNTIEIIEKFYEFFSKNSKINKIVHICDLILKNKEKIINFLLKGYDEISLPGTEFNFLRKIFNINQNKSEQNLVYFQKNSNSDNIFVSHSDEAGGLLVDGKIYNLGTYNWKSGLYNLYDLSGKIVGKTNGIPIEESKWSVEYQAKIPRSRLKIDYENKENEILQIVSSQKTLFNEHIFLSRNHDNRINTLILSIFDNFEISKFNFLITTREEVQLQSAKTAFVKEIIQKNNFIYNLEVSASQHWDKENLLIRVADFYTGINAEMINKIARVFDDFAIPFKYYFGSGSTDQTEFQFKNSVTIAIPANEIHSYSSKILIKNIFYMFLAIGVLNDSFSEKLL